MTTSAQVVETSVTTTDNRVSQDYTQPDDQTILLHLVVYTIFYFFYQTQNELTQNKGNLKPRYEHTQVDPTYHRVSGAQWQSIRARYPKV